MTSVDPLTEHLLVDEYITPNFGLAEDNATFAMLVNVFMDNCKVV